MKKILSCLMLVIISITFFNCNPNDNEDENPNSNVDLSQNFGAAASRDFIGQVVDSNNHPIQNATVNIGTSTVQTDVNGVFIVNGANVYEKFAYIKAKKVGYIDGSRSLVPTTGMNNVKIMMISSAPIATIASGISSEVTLPSGTKVVFDGAFETAAGVAYTGSVAVSMFHLKSSDENISSLMPGMLYAQAADGSPKVLETYGMMEVELRGSGGEKLQIAKTHTAQIKMQIDSSQMATAPGSIPLWHFDEVKGYWKEEGTATKVGNQYVGNVSHFSWWNCDIPNSSIFLSFTFKNADGNLLSNQALMILNDEGYVSHGSTDTNGQVAGFFPTNEELKVKISTIVCEFTKSLGTFNTSAVVPAIVVGESTIVSNSKIVGRLLKCDNTNVNNGYVMLGQNANVMLAPVTNGDFSFNQFYCPENASFSLLGFDYDNFQQTGSIEYNFKAPTTFVGNLITCNSINEFVSFQVDNGPVVFYITNLWTSFEFFYPTTNPYGITFKDNWNEGLPPNFNIWIRDQLPGYYHNAVFTANSDLFGNLNSAVNVISSDFNIAKSGPIGEYIDMTFDGTYYDANNVIRRLRGTVHTIRKN